MSADITWTFTGTGDFAAHAAAVSYLRARRFSVGPMQGNDPVAALHGVNKCVGKWRSIPFELRALAHATITAADMRTGPVTVTIFAHAPAAARAAVASTKAA